MTAQLPWPDSYLSAPTWTALGKLLSRLAWLGERSSLPGTLMLEGEPGLGREALAVELAAALICRSGGRPGCQCGSCERVRRGVHPDLAVLEVAPGKSEILIEQVREVVDNVLQRPFEGRRRVYVVASCHNPPLNEHASSALLKTLEEPPSHATFLLLANNPARALPTIVSRAVLLRVPRPSEAELIELLTVHHGTTNEEAVAALAAASGNPALALEALGPDQADTARQQRESLESALRGDALSLLRFASMARQAVFGGMSGVAWLVDTLQATSPERVERQLEAALALLRAERRHATLRVDLEGAIIGALASLTGSSREG